jgi:hypothetical protein
MPQGIHCSSNGVFAKFLQTFMKLVKFCRFQWRRALVHAHGNSDLSIHYFIIAESACKFPQQFMFYTPEECFDVCLSQ